MRIGLIALSAKPAHKGHDLLMRLASRENDEVHVYVSLSDRQFIKGIDMHSIWKRYIESTLPENIKVSYGGSPISNIWNELGFANEHHSDDVYAIYSDVNDINKNFPTKSLLKYVRELYENGQIVLEPIDRSETIDISGTQMRNFLQQGDKELFLSYLPDSLKKHGNEIWVRLRSSVK